MTQSLLPFREFQVPAWTLLAFHLANACNYPERKYWFYPFKDEFLRSHGVTDGLDLQIIKVPCGCGDGIWRGLDYTVPRRYWETCDRCEGTAVWKVVYVVLQRWSLAGHLYHTRTNIVHTAEDANDCFREVFTGRITHAPVPVWQGRAACLALLLAYDRADGERLLSLFARLALGRAAQRLARPFRRVDVWLADSLPDDFLDLDDSDAIPF